MRREFACGLPEPWDDRFTQLLAFPALAYISAPAPNTFGGLIDGELPKSEMSTMRPHESSCGKRAADLPSSSSCPSYGDCHRTAMPLRASVHDDNAHPTKAAGASTRKGLPWVRPQPSSLKCRTFRRCHRFTLPKNLSQFTWNSTRGWIFHRPPISS